jgi:GxxExxY protein
MPGGGIRVRREVGIPAMYKGEPLQLGFRADILVDETVVLEIKAVPTLLPVHDMQLQTYLGMSGFPVGLLFNFHAPRLPRAPSSTRPVFHAPRLPRAPSSTRPI